MKTKNLGFFVVSLFLIFFWNCSKQSVIIHEESISSSTQLNYNEIMLFDSLVTIDGNGSIKVVTDSTVTIPLIQTGDLDLENTSLVFEAYLKTENLTESAYLEMLCTFPDQGEFFSRALHAKLTGTSNWVKQSTPFLLKKGENPSNIKLNLIIEGAGTVWIDDLKLLSNSF